RSSCMQSGGECMSQLTLSSHDYQHDTFEGEVFSQQWTNRKSHDQLEHNLHACIAGSQLIPHGHNDHLEAFCAQTLRNICALSDARAGALLLLPLRHWEPVLHVVTGTASTSDVRFTYHPGAGWPGWIIQHRQPLLIHDCDDHAALRRITTDWTWHDPYAEGLTACRIHSQYLGAPLLVEQEVIGVVGLLRHRRDPTFMAVDKHSLQAMAERVAVAIER